MKHNKVVHERLVLLTVVTEEIPRVEDRDRVTVHCLGSNTYRIIIRYGFTEDPDLPHALALCEPYGLSFEMMDTTFFLGRATLIPRTAPGWRCGAKDCSPTCFAPPLVRWISFASRTTGWWNWALKSNYSRVYRHHRLGYLYLRYW